MTGIIMAGAVVCMRGVAYILFGKRKKQNELKIHRFVLRESSNENKKRMSKYRVKTELLWVLISFIWVYQ
jgi:hypothetical protein